MSHPLTSFAVLLRFCVSGLLPIGLLVAASLAWAQSQPDETKALLPQAQLSGTAKLTFWGFDVYNAELWVGPGFRRDQYEQHEFCLELSYLRAFSNAAIAERSIDEMRRHGNFTESQAQRWEKQLKSAYPSVKKGDRIVGVNLPGKGVVFFTNGKKTGEVLDPELARLFFGIWLAPTTSEPQLRKALLARTEP
ncbi:MAG: chalcone isomerase family protein [Burkholderiaceae bacterium]